MVQPTLLISFLFLIFHLSVTGVFSAKFTVVNQCNYTVWPASYTTTSSTSTTTTNETATLSTTGFVLKPGENSTVTAPDKWSGRFWGRTLCKTDSVTRNFSCVTGDCGSGKITCDKGGSPPVTLAEFSLSSYSDRDFYDVSLVDGYNVPMEVIPLGNGKCNSTGCPADLNAVCPTELKVVKNETVVACKVPCAAFNLQFFCCEGNYSSPKTCQPSVYSQIFKSSCPKAYSYVYDDGTSTFQCPATDYQILFCPASTTNSRAQIMLMEPLPTISKVYSMLIQQERQNGSSVEEPKVLAAAAFQAGSQGRGGGTRGRGDRGRGNGRGGGRGTKVCSYCGRTGHTVDVCYKKHGYPPHLQQNSINNCTAETGNNEEEEGSYEEEQADTGKQNITAGNLSFTPEQHKAILALLQGSSNSLPINHFTTIKSGLPKGETDWDS